MIGFELQFAVKLWMRMTRLGQRKIKDNVYILLRKICIPQNFHMVLAETCISGETLNKLLPRVTTDWSADYYVKYTYTDIIRGMGSANERRRCILASSPIGWAHTQKDPRYTLWVKPMFARYIISYSRFFNTDMGLPCANGSCSPWIGYGMRSCFCVATSIPILSWDQNSR